MLNIGGLQKVSLLDYPGKVAASVFLVGCNFRCSYCHNPELVRFYKNKKYIKEKDFFDLLQKRKNILDGVCVSGGEPLLFVELEDFLKKIKNLGLLIKIDTNGTSPKFLQQLIDNNLVNYIAMDIKAPFNLYSEVTGVKVDVNKIQESIKIIMDSGLDYEFRTTVLAKWHNLENMEKIVKMIKGAKNYYIQNFRPGITLDPNFKNEKGLLDQELKEIQKLCFKYIKNCQIRS